MRMTLHAANRNLQNNIMDNFIKLSDMQEKIATGRRLNRPSDDPVDVTGDLRIRGNLKALKQYKRNISDGMSFMQVTDSSLVSMNDILQRTRELGIQASNDTYTAKERKFINEEISQLLGQVISLVDSTYKGEYIFGGTNNKVPPYEIKDGAGTVTINAGGAGTPIDIIDDTQSPTISDIYNVIPGSITINSGGTTYLEGRDYTVDYKTGQITPITGEALDDPTNPINITVTYKWVKDADESNTDAIYREIEQGVTPRINISADTIFKNKKHNTSMVDTIIELGQSLVQDDSSGIRDALTNLDYMFESVLSAQAENGSKVNRFELTLERNEMQTVEVTRLLSDLEDADMAELITEFSMLQNAYSASLKAGARVIQPSLMDFIG